MGEPTAGGITSIRQIMDNADWVTNWVTGLVISGGLSLLVATVADRLTFAAIVTSFFTSTFLAGCAYPAMVAYGYGGLLSTMFLALCCGAGGIILLLTLVGVIRKFIQKDVARIAESALHVPPEEERC